MSVTFLEYRSNSYCNNCFDARASSKPVSKDRLNTFEFMGEIINLSESNNNFRLNKTSKNR